MSDGAFVLRQIEDVNFYTRFTDGDDRQALLDGFNTLVHEGVHRYNLDAIEKIWYDNYYITQGISIQTIRQRVFNSSELNLIVPEEVQSKIFRYKTYIGDSSRVGSQLNGFYGILEEFGAYYHGTKADLELRDYYETFCDSTASICWIKKFLGNTTSTVHAYYEFRLFMSWYLRYAEIYHPKHYKTLYQDQNLRIAFTLYDGLFTDLVSEFFQMRVQLLEDLRASGVDVQQIDYSIVIYFPESNKAYSYDTFDNELEFLKAITSDEDIAELEKFKIQGVTLDNFQDFVE